MCENGDGSLFLLSFPFQLCGVCSNIPVPPLSEELLQAEKPNKPPSPSESQTFTRSCRKCHFPLGRGEVWPRLQRQVAVSSPAVAASQAPAPPPPPTFLCSGNSGSYICDYLPEQNGAEVSSDGLLFSHSTGALFPKRDRKTGGK